MHLFTRRLHFLGCAAHPSLKFAGAKIAEGKDDDQELLKSQVG